MTDNVDDMLCFAADMYDLKEITRWVDILSPHVKWFKIGIEAVYEGIHPEAIEYIKKNGMRVIVDVKTLDVPETVGRGIDRLARHGPDCIIVHGEGLQGKARLQAAMENRQAVEILAHTVLTSIDAEKDMRSPVKTLVYYATRNAVTKGVHGVITHPRYVKFLNAIQKDRYKKIKKFTSGIRPKGAEHDDHMKPFTPYEAVLAGSDMLILGRPVRDAKDPVRVVCTIRKNIQRALKDRGETSAPE